LFTGEPTSVHERDDEDWAPSINLGHNSVKKVDRKRKERYSVIKEKRRRTASAEALLSLQFHNTDKQEVTCNDIQEELLSTNTALETIETALKFREFGTQTDMNASDIRSLESEVIYLRKANSELKQELKEVSLDEDGFQDKDEKVLFYRLV